MKGMLGRDAGFAACRKGAVTCTTTQIPEGLNVQLCQAKWGFLGKQIKIRNPGIVCVLCELSAGWTNEGVTERESGRLSGSEDDVDSWVGEHGAAHVSDLQREWGFFKRLLHLTWHTHVDIDRSQWIKFCIHNTVFCINAYTTFI